MYPVSVFPFPDPPQKNFLNFYLLITVGKELPSVN